MSRLKRLRKCVVLTLSATLAFGLAGYSQASSPAPESRTSASGPSTPEPVQDWFDYNRPAEYESVVSKVQVPTRDGTKLGCNLVRPGHDGKPDGGAHPGLVIDFYPYAMNNEVAPAHKYFAERGYNVLNCFTRGSGTSGGGYPSWFPKVEARDNYDLIEWFADQPYSTGDVAQMGSSYGSITSYRAAALKPPSLRAIVPIVSPTNIYSEWVYPGGAPSTMGFWPNWPVTTPEDHARTLKTFQDNTTYNSFWQQVATTNKLEDVDVPALHIGGYFDIFKEGSFDALKQRPDRTWLLTGPWTHGGFLALPGEDAPSAVDLSYGAILQWFDHWLMDGSEAELPPSRVVSFESTSKEGEGSWVADSRWPLTGTSSTRLYPTADGRLVTTPPASSESRYAVNPYDGPSVARLGTMPHDASQNQAPSETDGFKLDNGRCSNCARTTFTLPAFDADTTVAGPVTLNLSASITAEDTYFVSKLETVLPDGKVLPIETGSLRAQLRSSLSRTEKITPGRPTQYTIDLGNMHWRFKDGEKLRVTLSGGDFPNIQPTAPAGLVTIHHGPKTYVDLPVVGE